MCRITSLIFPLLVLATALQLSSCANLQGRWYFAPSGPDSPRQDQLDMYFVVLNKGRVKIDIASIKLLSSTDTTRKCNDSTIPRWRAETDSSRSTLQPGEIGVWKLREQPPGDNENDATSICEIPKLACIADGEKRFKPIKLTQALPNMLPSAWSDDCRRNRAQKEPSHSGESNRPATYRATERK